MEIRILPSTVSLTLLLFLLSICGDSVRSQEPELSSEPGLSCYCYGPFYCTSNNSCVARVNDEITAKHLACLVTKEFYKDGEISIFAKCQASNVFDYDLFCLNPKRVTNRTDNNGVLTKTIVTYCCQSDFCNSYEAIDDVIAELNPRLPDIFYPPSPSPTSRLPTHTPSDNSAPTTLPPTQPPAYAIGIIVALSVTVILILGIIGVVLLLHCYPNIVSHSSKGSSIGTSSFPVDSGSYGDPSLNELLEDSGSGSGLPLLIQRSIAGQITLHNLIGKGRFGEVWKGVYKGDDVAVKIFHTREELSWFHEVEVYQTCLLRHPNILRFIAADNKDIGLQMQLWLITEFCEFGSLFDLLTRQSFDQATVLRLCYTAACGIDHLHTEIFGTEGKPAIAHRDLKSRNILVKADYSCCIADLGLALKYERTTDTVKEPPRTTVGTKRYLAPEILDENIAVKNFESFKRSDIYSFGLVMWEIGRRGECGGHAEEAQLPYFDLIPSDPTLEEVRKLVVVDRRRPSLPNTWNQHETMIGLAKIIQQCWLHEAEARLTALRIKKSLANLQELRKEGKEQRQS